MPSAIQNIALPTLYNIYTIYSTHFAYIVDIKIHIVSVRRCRSFALFSTVTGKATENLLIQNIYGYCPYSFRGFVHDWVDFYIGDEGVEINGFANIYCTTKLKGVTTGCCTFYKRVLTILCDLFKSI